MSSVASTASGHQSSKEHQDIPVDDNESGTRSPRGVEQQAEQPKSNDPEYVTGIKLWSMMSGVILVIFLMLLDVSIVSTVSNAIPWMLPKDNTDAETGHT